MVLCCGQCGINDYFIACHCLLMALGKLLNADQTDPFWVMIRQSLELCLLVHRADTRIGIVHANSSI